MKSQNIDEAADSAVDAAAPCSVRCEVVFPHCREIDGVLYMLEPMFSGILTLPNDDDTQKAISRGWLKEVPPNATGEARGGSATLPQDQTL